MGQTTGGFSSQGLALEARTLELASLSQKQAVEIGQIAMELGFDRGLTITVQVQDHLLGVEILTEFLARKGELI